MLIAPAENQPISSIPKGTTSALLANVSVSLQSTQQPCCLRLIVSFNVIVVFDELLLDHPDSP